MARNHDLRVPGIDARYVPVARADVRDPDCNPVVLDEDVVDGDAGVRNRVVEPLQMVRVPLAAAMGFPGLVDHEILRAGAGTRLPAPVGDRVDVAANEGLVLVRTSRHESGSRAALLLVCVPDMLGLSPGSIRGALVDEQVRVAHRLRFTTLRFDRP